MLKRLGLIMVVFFSLATVLMADVPIRLLLSEGKSFDRQQVTIIGEIIGDVFYRKDFVWLNILAEDGTAIGVRAEYDILPKINHLGAYKHKGDTMLVNGKFFMFDDDQQGETYIAANQLKIIEPGYLIQRPFAKAKFTVAILLLLAALLISYATNYSITLRTKNDKPRELKSLDQDKELNLF